MSNSRKVMRVYRAAIAVYRRLQRGDWANLAALTRACAAALKKGKR